MKKLKVNDSPTEQAYEDVLYLYRFFNERIFSSMLPEALITFQRTVNAMGYVSIGRWATEDGRSANELAINPSYFIGSSFEEVCQTMVHEQCHIWQAVFGRPGRRGYHNKEWANKMISIGLMPSDTGYPKGRETGEKMNDFIIAGSLFHHACLELLNNNRKMTWFDLQPASQLYRRAKIFSLEGEEYVPFKNNDAASTENIIGSAFCGESATANNVDTTAVTLIEKRPQTRAKYKCAGCAVQIWGKFGLKVLCAECNIQFKEMA